MHHHISVESKWIIVRILILFVDKLIFLCLKLVIIITLLLSAKPRVIYSGSFFDIISSKK